jgi:hypothetical protein
MHNEDAVRTLSAPLRLNSRTALAVRRIHQCCRAVPLPIKSHVYRDREGHQSSNESINRLLNIIHLSRHRSTERQRPGISFEVVIDQLLFFQKQSVTYEYPALSASLISAPQHWEEVTEDALSQRTQVR